METRTREQDETHWQDVRERAAIAVLGGFLSDWDPEWSPNDYAKRAVIYANELVEELKKQDSQILDSSAKNCKDKQKQALIDKACEWLEEHLYDDKYIFRDNEGTWVDSYSLNEGLKQAMKGGEK